MEMRGYLMTIAQDVKPEMLGDYQAALPPIYKRFGGSYVALGGPHRGCNPVGNAPPRSLMMAMFPSREAVSDFWWDPEYRAAVPLREGAGRFTVIGFSGIWMPPAASLVVVIGDAPVALDSLGVGVDMDSAKMLLEGSDPGTVRVFASGRPHNDPPPHPAPEQAQVYHLPINPNFKEGRPS